MLDEGMKLLGPFPIFQVILGLAVLGGGVFMMIRGLTGDGRKPPVFSIEDKRAEWAAYEQLRNIEENSFKMVELSKQNGDLLRKLDDSIKALASAIWNRGA